MSRDGTRAMGPGALVIVSDQRSRGVARIERAVGPAQMRLFFYATGKFAVYATSELEPCPVGFPMQTGDAPSPS